MLGIKSEIEKLPKQLRAQGLTMWNAETKKQAAADCTACARHAGQSRLQNWLRQMEQDK
jgi:hypothetical protein